MFAVLTASVVIYIVVLANYDELGAALTYQGSLSRSQQSKQKINGQANSTSEEEEDMDPADEKPCDLSRFIEIQTRIMKNSGEKSPRISYNRLDSNGYGNRVFSFLTTMVIGILTDRALLINNWPQITTLIEEPLLGAYTLHNDSSGPFNVFEDSYEKDATYMPNWAVEFNANKNITQLINTTFPTHTNRISNKQCTAGFMAICANPRYHDKLYSYGLMSKSAYKNASEKANNTKYSVEERLDAVLRVGFEVGANLLRLLWRPHQNVTQYVQSHMDTFFRDHYVIGIQMRVEFIRAKDVFPIMDAFFDCAKQIEQQRVNKSQPVRWFFSTDAGWTINHYGGKFGKTKLAFTTIPYANWTVEIEDMRLMVDNELLSKSDEIIVTGGSTFGFVAAMRAAKLPYYIKVGENSTECTRSTLARPPIRKLDRRDLASF